MTERVPCAAAIVFDRRGRLLLVERARPPGVGLWSIPGGRCEPGEAPSDACTREVREETGLDVAVLRWVGQVERPAPDGRIYVIDDFLCEVIGPVPDSPPRAGDDAAAARWVTPAEFDALYRSAQLTPGLRAALVEWGLLPR